MGLLKKTDYTAKITEIKGKIPSLTGLATTIALSAVENKIANASNLRGNSRPKLSSALGHYLPWFSFFENIFLSKAV